MRFTRREILKAGAALGVAPAVVRLKRSTERIAVVGGGLAGLTAAYRIFAETGQAPTLFEAAERLGGRVLTHRPEGAQYFEGGGAFISSGDKAIRSLARELGVGLVDLDDLWPSGRTRYFFDGQRRKASQVFKGWRATERAAERWFEKIEWPVSHRTRDRATRRLDRMTVAEWIEDSVPQGLDGLLGAYLKVYLETEYGGPVADASALQIVADFAAPGRNYDERYLVRGGSGRVIEKLEQKLPSETVRKNSPLARLARGGGTYSLETGGTSPENFEFDVVVLALPFTALRDVDLTDAGLGAGKLEAIQRLGMGRGAKVHTFFDSAGWAGSGNGESMADLVTGSTWPGEVGQRDPGAMVVALTADTDQATQDGTAHGPATAGEVERQLAALEKIFPKARGFATGGAYVDAWTHDPWIGGTYSYYPVSTFTDIAGLEGRRSGGIYFAGEHTARYGNSGTMNGAVWSGERVAARIVSAL